MLARVVEHWTERRSGVQIPPGGLAFFNLFTKDLESICLKASPLLFSIELWISVIDIGLIAS